MNMNCCEQSGPGVKCNQGRDCPVRGAIAFPKTVGKSCNELGVCQHPAKQCKTACELPESEPLLRFEGVLDWLDAISGYVLAGAVAAVVIGLTAFIWGNV